MLNTKGRVDHVTMFVVPQRRLFLRGEITGDIIVQQHFRSCPISHFTVYLRSGLARTWGNGEASFGSARYLYLLHIT
jgi:hypothetical protein